MNEKKENKVLMISYIFPPLGSGANQRTVRFVKYLGHFGWTPIVLTIKKGYYRYDDDYFLRIIPEFIKIHRVFSIEPARFQPITKMIKSALKAAIRILLRRKTVSIVSESENSPSIYRGNIINDYKHISSGMKSLYTYLISLFNMYILIPDDRIGWLPFALFRGIRIIYREKPSIIWANADMKTDLMIGCLLKLFTKRRLVLNFSDPWVLNAYYPIDRNSVRAKIDSFIERFVIRKADITIFATPSMQFDYEKEYQEDHGKFCTILNGYDADEFNENHSFGNSSKFILTYCGSLQFFRSPEPLLKAIETLIDQNPWVLSTLLVQFVGLIEHTNLCYFESFKYKNIIYITGQVSYRKSIQYILQSDACLVITGNANGSWTEMTGKVFEYMAAKKPILVISRKSAVADLVKELEIGIVVRPDNVKSIQLAILKFMKEKGSQSYYKDKEGVIEKYSRKSLTGELAGCFNELLR